MPRKARIRCESAAGFYHIVIKGNNNKYIFKEKRFKLDFYEFLCEQGHVGLIELAACCIMDNHVHVIQKAKVIAMSEAFKSINIKLAFRHNTDTGSVGHVYDNRYISKAIETDEYLMRNGIYLLNR